MVYSTIGIGQLELDNRNSVIRFVQSELDNRNCELDLVQLGYRWITLIQTAAH